MKIKLLGMALLSSALLLTACGQENDKKEDSKPKEEQKKTDEIQTEKNVTNIDSNNHSETVHNNISPQEAEQIVSNYYINRGSNGLQALEFKTNMDRSNANEYYVEHLVRDAAGTPIKFCAVVNRNTGEVVDRFNDMSEEEMAEFEEFKKRSPKYKTSDEKIENTEQENSQPMEQQEAANNPVIEQAKNEEIGMNTPSDEETKDR